MKPLTTILAISLNLVLYTTEAQNIIVKFALTPQQRILAHSSSGWSKVAQTNSQSLNPSVLETLATATRFYPSDQIYDIDKFELGGRILRTSRQLTESELSIATSRLMQTKLFEYVQVESPLSIQLSSVGMSKVVPEYQWTIVGSDKISNIPYGTYYGANFATDVSGAKLIPSFYGSNITIAVIDTGYLPHPAIVNNLVALDNNKNPGEIAYGASFSRWGGGIGPVFYGYTPGAIDNSDYDFIGHGTAVISTIVGNGTVPGHPDKYMVGAAPGAKILPINSDDWSDLLLAKVLIWLANISPVENWPRPSQPARVVNFSMNWSIECSPAVQDAINVLASHGTLVVAAATNKTQDVAKAGMPVNCNKVITVAAVNSKHHLTYYSNYGNITIAAPGGEVYQDLSSLDWNELTQHLYEGVLVAACTAAKSTIAQCRNHNSNPAIFGYTLDSGTSFATPLVSAAIADALSIDPSLSYEDIIKLLKASAAPFSSTDNCTPNSFFIKVKRGGCLAPGVGMLDTQKFLDLVKQHQKTRR